MILSILGENILIESKDLKNRVVEKTIIREFLLLLFQISLNSIQQKQQQIYLAIFDITTTNKFGRFFPFTRASRL